MSNYRSPSQDTASISETARSTQPDGPSLGRSLCEFESFEYDPEESVCKVVYDHDEVSFSTAVVNAIAAITDTNLREIEPLYSVVDPDTLDALATARYGSVSDLTVTFSFQGYEVTASGVGSLRFQQQDVVSPQREQPPDSGGTQ